MVPGEQFWRFASIMLEQVGILQERNLQYVVQIEMHLESIFGAERDKLDEVFVDGDFQVASSLTAGHAGFDRSYHHRTFTERLPRQRKAVMSSVKRVTFRNSRGTSDNMRWNPLILPYC